MDILTQMLAELPLGSKELHALIATAPRRYKIYQIPKRAPGQFRTIAHPSRELKLVQRWLVKRVLKPLPIHDAAMAYRSGISILNNAQKHVNQRYLLRLDIRDFFPSIKPVDFLKHCTANGFAVDPASARILTQLLFKRDPRTGMLELAIGAPSSPLVSNSIFFGIDQKIDLHCNNAGIVYTRYADDLTFSTNTPRLLAEMPAFVSAVLATADYPKLKLKTEKTTHSSHKNLRKVTGLILTPDRRISIGREKKRCIKALVHQYLMSKLSVEKIENLKGQISFIHSVEPDFIESLRRKYGREAIALLTPKTVPGI